MNVHDEIMCSHVPELSNKIKEVVDKTVESFREKVPLIGMNWKIGLKNWGEK